MTSKVQNYLYGYCYYKWDKANQRFVFDSGIHESGKWNASLPHTITKDVFNPGDNILNFDWNYGLRFQSRTVPADSQWHILSANAQMIGDAATYNFNTDGFSPAFYWEPMEYYMLMI